MLDKKSTHNSGFTIIELAVVLVIVAILLGGFISTLSSRIESARKSDTRDELKEIKKALIAYAFVNGFLPCPDCSTATGACVGAVADDGQADYDNTAGIQRCFDNEGLGNVPWSTLGLGRGDAWGTRYRYVVQNEYANSLISFTLDGVTGPNGSVVIQEPNFELDATGATPRPLASSAVAALFSHGKNSYGGSSVDGVARLAIPAANADEIENVDNDQVFHMRAETSVGAAIAGGEFDDIVVWISEYELKGKMVEAGKLP